MKRAPWMVACIALAAARVADAADEHVPPEPPGTRVHPMSYDEMAQMMGMDDRAHFHKVMLNRLEWLDTAQPAVVWDAAAWYGGDFDKLWLEAEGTRSEAGVTHDSRVELLWDRIATRWWSTRLGVRSDSGIGPARTWAAFGVAGLAPGFVELEAMAYLGESGRTALRLKAELDVLLTQRWILRPAAELDVYGQDDAARLIGAGISEIELGLRLRYEIRREFAPYIGSTWRKRVGGSSGLARAAGEAPDDLAWMAGIRAWF